MSLIKSNAVQIGQSNTATENFTLAVPSSPDGTIKLARGNSGATTQDVLSVDASGNVNGLVQSTGSSTARSLANRFADVVNVLDFGADPTGATDSTTAIQNWWTYILSKLDQNETQTNPQPVAGYVPTGTYKSASGLTLEANKYRVQIFGDGWNSRFENVQFNVIRPFFQLKDIALSGTTGVSYGVRFTKDIPNNFNPNSSKVINTYIRNRSVGIQIESGAQFHINECMVHRCGIGIKIAGGPEGQDIINTEVSSCTIGGVLINSAGETKFDTVRCLNNAGYGLKIQKDSSTVISGNTIGAIPIESYIVNSTITNNGGTLPSGTVIAGTITGIATYSGGAAIEVTTASNHELTRGQGFIKLSGTGVVGYDNITTSILDVTANNKVVLDLAYISNATSGSINSEGWDLIIESASTSPDVTDNRNWYFVGGNINNTKIAGAYNIQFWGTRLTRRIYLDKNLANQYNSQISFNRVGPSGEYCAGDSSISNSERVKEIPISGPGSLVGWTEFCHTQSGKPSWGGGFERVRMRAPIEAAGLLPDRTPAKFSEIYVSPEGTYIDSYPTEIIFSLSDDSATSFTIPISNLVGIISLTVLSGGQPFLTGSGQIALDCGTTPETVKYLGGSTLEVLAAGGILNGTTGTDGKITVSAYNNGVFYVENRTGGGKNFKIKYLN